MQRHSQELRAAERRALAALSWVVLAGSVACALLSVRAFVEQARPASIASAAATRPAGPAVSLAPVSAAPAARSETPPRTVRVVGSVREESGDPLAGARVEARSALASGVSDASGAYEIVVALREGQAPLLRFSATGYENEKVPLRPRELEAFEEVQVDVRLARVGTRAVIAGVVRDTHGHRIEGQTAQLQSTALGANYAAVTNADGAFSIRRVKVGGVYDLIVRPDGAYADHWQRGIRVPREGVALEVVLEPLATRRLEGRVVDEEGRPVSGFDLSIRSEVSSARTLSVQSDAEGRFAADGVPVGALHFATLSPPRHVIRGAHADGKGEIEIVVDSGDRRLDGRVLDDRGEPVAGVQLDLAWLHSSAELQSSSIRRSVSDTQGAFHFGGLGPGSHRLIVSAQEHHAPTAAIEVPASAGEVEVRLDRVRP